MQVEMMRISDLRPHPRNPRKHPERAIEKLEHSLKEFGWTNPVLLSADGFVLAGHARLKAAAKAGIEQVPVIRLQLSGARAEAYMIADNRLQEETDWDLPALKDLLDDLDTSAVDLRLTGYDMDELEQMIQMAYDGETIEHDMDSRKAGASPWERMDGEGAAGVIFHFGSLTCKLPQNIYDSFAALVDETDLTESITEVLLRAIRDSG